MTNSPRQSDFILSIVPPGDAVALAERLAPAIKRAGRKTDLCRLQRGLAADRGAHRRGAEGHRLHLCGCRHHRPAAEPNRAHDLLCLGPGAKEFERLAERGLTIRLMDGPNGAASAMKLSYAGITKGCTAIGSAMMLGATRGGTADALLQELSESQPMLLELDARLRLAHAAEGLSLGRRDGGDRPVPGRRSGRARHVSRHRALLRADRRGARCAEAGRRGRAAEGFLSPSAARRSARAPDGVALRPHRQDRDRHRREQRHRAGDCGGARRRPARGSRASRAPRRTRPRRP